MGSPQKILDPAVGRGEFIGAVPAKETWAVDEVSYPEANHRPGTTVIASSICLPILLARGEHRYRGCSPGPRPEGSHGREPLEGSTSPADRR